MNDAAAPCTTPGSGSNHVVARAYDPLGDLSSTTDWLGNTVTYGYTLTYGRPDLASIVVPSGTGATETQSIAHNADGQVTAIGYAGDTSLASLNAVTDTYAYVTASSLSPLNSSSTIAQTSSTPTYSQTSQILTATNQGATASDTYTYAANDALKSDARPPTTTSPKTFTYSASTEALTSSKPATGNATFYAHNALGQRCTQLTAASDPALTCLALGSMTSYGWTSLGQLASVSGPTSASTFAYDARGLRTMSSTTAASTTTTSTYAYDTVDGGRVPQLLSDTANSYVYGPGMGGTAPVEQISGSGAVSFCFSAPSGVQAVVTKATSSTASLSELANYSIHGTRTLSAAGPTLASPFGFQGAYTDASTGFLYLFNRYYDPRSAQFLSVDPALLSTAQPYALDGGNSLNMVDPLGLQGWYCMQGTSQYYKGDIYGAVGPGPCGFGQFGQYCNSSDSLCLRKAFFINEAAAAVFDDAMVKLSGARSEVPPTSGTGSGISDAGQSAQPAPDSSGWLGWIGQVVDHVAHAAAGCVLGMGYGAMVSLYTAGAGSVAFVSIGCVIGAGFGFNSKIPDSIPSAGDLGFPG